MWRRDHQRVMNDQDVDDVAFLTGTDQTHSASAQFTQSSIRNSSSFINQPCDSGGVVGTESPTGHGHGHRNSQTTTKKTLYENNGVAACSHNRALCIATIVFALLFTIALIIAFTGPQSGKLRTPLSLDYLRRTFYLRLYLRWRETSKLCG